MPAEIRRATPDDAAIIALLGRITFTETFGHLFTAHEHERRTYLDATFAVSKLEQSLRKTQNLYWLAFEDRFPAGYAKLKRPSPSRDMQNAAQLQKIYLLRDHLGAGLGAPLLNHALREAQQRTRTIWLDVLHENARAIRFYKNHGFVSTGQDTYTIGSQTFQFERMIKELA